MPATTQETLSATAAKNLFDTLPDKIKTALLAYATEMDYPIEAVIEIAIASFLDEDAVSFADCRPLSAIGNQN
jgi:hypothetical protein